MKTIKTIDMEIGKGYTYPQFINILRDSKLNAFQRMVSLFAFTDLCEQPLKKEMFVNDKYDKPEREFYPDDKEGNIEYLGHLNSWKQVEKEVIFKGFGKVIGSDFIVNGEIEVSKNLRISINYTASFQHYETLGDLFTATNGTLKLQNVKL